MADSISDWVWFGMAHSVNESTGSAWTYSKWGYACHLGVYQGYSTCVYVTHSWSSTIFERYKISEAKLYLHVTSGTDHPLYDALDHTKGNRLKRSWSWMAQAEQTIGQFVNIADIYQGEEWIRVSQNCHKYTE